jgi:methionine sulfoxide reductase heme-binding subunit
MAVAASWFLTSKADWYLMRGSGIVSLLLFTAVVLLGIATVKRWRPGRLPRFVTPSLHRSISLLAVVFLAVHVATAVIDPYAMVGVAAVFVPFVAGKSALWVGLGALSLDLIAVLVVSSLLRRHIGARLWRALHWLAYLSWPVAVAHTLGTGTDASTVWLRSLTGACVALVGIAVALRLRSRTAGKHVEPQPVPAIGESAWIKRSAYRAPSGLKVPA